MRVAVTAGAGFLGKALSLQLTHQGHEVQVIDRRTTNGVTKRAAELTLADLLHTDVLYHLEWSGSFKQAAVDPKGTENHNLKSLSHVQKLCQQSNTRLIFTSTSLVYQGTQTHPAKETEDIGPKSAYGQQKLCAEELIGESGTSVRVFNLYGPESTDTNQIIPRLIAAVRGDGKVTLNGDGMQTRDFVHRDDAARALALLAAHPCQGKVYNLSSGTPVTMLGLCKTVFELANRTPDISFNPAVPGESRMICGDPSALKHLTGWEPKVSLEEGLRKRLGLV